MTYPERQGWVVHHQDKQCHPLCPPGICFEGVEADILSRGDHYRAHGPMSPMFSRADGSPMTSASKAAFIQSWLFFGTLHEVSNMCGLSIDIQAEFVVDDGRAVSTAPLNGLAGRWFLSLNSGTVGNTVFMERVLAITRQMSLFLTREVLVRPGLGPRFRYTPQEARVLLSVDVVLRVLALHLLLHVNSPGFSAAADECWDAGRISTVVDLVGRPREGNWDLAGHGASDDGRASRGWCESEVASFEFSGSDAYRFVAVLERPPLRDHSSCDDMTCVAYQVDVGVYRTAHAATILECTCGFAGVPAEDLVRQLAQDKVPAVVIGEDLEIRVVDSSEHPYAAFSHVCEWFSARDELGADDHQGLTAWGTRDATRYPSASFVVSATTQSASAVPMVDHLLLERTSSSGSTRCASRSSPVSKNTGTKPSVLWARPSVPRTPCWCSTGNSRPSLQQKHPSLSSASGYSAVGG